MAEGHGVALHSGTGMANAFLNNTDEEVHLFMFKEGSRFSTKYFFPPIRAASFGGVLLAVAVDLGGGSRWVSALAAAAAVPVLALAAAGSTVSVVAISTAGGAAALAARVLAAALLVLAASVASAGRAASAVSTALALAGAALVIPWALRDAPPITCAVASLGVVAVSGVLARLRDRWTVTALAAAGLVGAVAGTAMALLSNRG